MRVFFNGLLFSERRPSDSSPLVRKPQKKTVVIFGKCFRQEKSSSDASRFGHKNCKKKYRYFTLVAARRLAHKYNIIYNIKATFNYVVYCVDKKIEEKRSVLSQAHSARNSKRFMRYEHITIIIYI